MSSSQNQELVPLNPQSSQASPYTEKQLKTKQILAFVLTFFSYAMLHSARTTWSYSKSFIEKDFGFENSFLGYLDFAFLGSYGLGMYLFGHLGDHVNLNTYIGVCLTGTSIAFASIGFVGFEEFYYKYLLLFLLFAHGSSQSIGLPGHLQVINRWYNPKKRGLIMGIWCICINMGNIIGQQISGLIIDDWDMKWWNAMFIVAICVLTMNVLTFQFLDTRPKVQIQQEQLSVAAVDQTKYDFLNLWKIPGVAIYATSFALIRVGAMLILYWLPYILQTMYNFKEDTAGIVFFYEFGMLIGNVIIGYLFDKFNYKVVLPLSLISSTFLFAYLQFEDTKSQNVLKPILFFIGILFGGPENIIPTAAGATLGSSEHVKSNKKAVSAAIGLIDGLGTICAAVFQMVVPKLKDEAFGVLAILALLGGVILSLAAFESKPQTNNYSVNEVESEQQKIRINK